MAKFNKLIIEKNPWSVMIESAVHTFPNECCGFFLALKGNGKMK